MLRLSNLRILESKEALKEIPQGKRLINTINAHSYNTAQNDELFAEALKNGDYLIPDGASIVKACRWLGCKSQPKERVAGWDLFEFEMGRLNTKGGRCMFMGSSEKVLSLIVEKAKTVYPNIEVVTYSPPYKPEFSEEDNRHIIAVGTTSLRTLEANYTKYGQFKSTYESTDIFIQPGYKFKAIDCLITNFHLPKSTLIMLVSALAGREFTLQCYEHAIENKYRFF